MKRGIVLYRLSVAPGEADGEGEDHDEWFTSLKLAKARRKELIDDDPELKDHRYGEDYQIDRCEFAPLPQRALLLRVLNRDGMFAVSVRVPPYAPPERQQELDRLASLGRSYAAELEAERQDPPYG